MDERTREELAARFRAYLDDAADQEPTGVDGSGHPVTDLFSLFSELVALKNEVKIESRQVRNALEQFREVFETMEARQKALEEELARANEERRAMRQTLLRPLLLELLDLHDRLESGRLRGAGTAGQGGLLARFCGRRHGRILAAVLEGQTITLSRLLHLLALHQVEPMEVLGELFDPFTMKAVETLPQPGRENGLVLGEIRKGFTWEGEVLRPSEVQVVKNS